MSRRSLSTVFINHSCIFRPSNSSNLRQLSESGQSSSTGFRKRTLQCSSTRQREGGSTVQNGRGAPVSNTRARAIERHRRTTDRLAESTASFEHGSDSNVHETSYRRRDTTQLCEPTTADTVLRRGPAAPRTTALFPALGLALLATVTPLSASAGEGLAEWGSSSFIGYVLSSVGCVALGGLMSGLTLGLLSLNDMDLQLLIRAGSPEERENALKVQPLVRKQHQLLVTLLLCNALAMEALPLFLDQVVGPRAAIGISVSLVVVFGEVVPQAVCSKYGLRVGSAAAPLVRFLMALCYPVAFPVSKILDAVLGDDHLVLYRRKELTALVDMSEDAGILSKDENSVIDGAMSLSGKTVVGAMTPLDHVFMVPMDAVLDQSLMMAMMSAGHSRIPVYASEDRQKVVGLLIMKSLLLHDPKDAAPVSELPLQPIQDAPASTPMYEMLDEMQATRSHMALVRGGEGEAVGIITLEDVVEELLQEEIYDEFDDTQTDANGMSTAQQLAAAQLWAQRLAHIQHKRQNRVCRPPGCLPGTAR